jgi:hypothetical protein
MVLAGERAKASDLAALESVAWTPFLPTWTNLTVGAGGVGTYSYCKIGRLVVASYEFVLGAGVGGGDGAVRDAPGPGVLEPADRGGVGVPGFVGIGRVLGGRVAVWVGDADVSDECGGSDGGHGDDAVHLGHRRQPSVHHHVPVSQLICPVGRIRTDVLALGWIVPSCRSTDGARSAAELLRAPRCSSRGDVRFSRAERSRLAACTTGHGHDRYSISRPLSSAVACGRARQIVPTRVGVARCR